MGAIIYGMGKNDKESIEFGWDKRLLKDYDELVRFVKGCEHCVRKDDRYNAYLSKLHTSGVDQCAVLGNVNKGGNKISLEMHHGPIFNLFDICMIVTRAMIKRGYEEVTTFDIGDLVLSAHENDWIQIVMLSKSAHKAAHYDLFVDIQSTVGKLDKFIAEYHDGMTDDDFESIEMYINECKKAPGTQDNGLFKTAEKLMKFK